MTVEKHIVEAGGGEREHVLADDDTGDRVDAFWQEEILDERASALDRTSQRLRRMLKELKAMEAEIDRLDLTSRLPGLSSGRRRQMQAEMDLSIDAYNYLREAASCSLRQLIQQREAFGFRGHESVHRCYPIPDLLLPPGPLEDLLEAEC